MKLGRREIKVKIYNRLNGVIKQQDIGNVISVLCDVIEDELVHNRAVSIKNFGTLSTYLFHGHKGFNVTNREVNEVLPFKSVKFRPHIKFSELVRARRDKFVKPRTRK